VLDDLADRPRGADLVLDSAYGRTPETYRALTPPGAVILTGPPYAPVRPEFVRLRPAALARRREGAAPRRVLIALGLTDVNAVTGRVVAAVRPVLTGMILDVVVGGAAPSLAGLRALAKADPHLRLHVDSQAMGDLMAAADFAIGAGGSSTWERATLGLPTVSVILADNQRPMAKAMAKAGLTLAADAADTEFEARLAQAARQLAEDAALRRAISERVSALCDGLGAERFANRLLGPGGRGLDTVQRPHDG
jgi:UDP-2,4-diacetamido-2,4,6-trideoxy-beta-L-altropyranose hydrolase